jgi:hypothetical protein
MGNYLLPPLPPDLISTIARNEPLDERHLQESPCGPSSATS